MRDVIGHGRRRRVSCVRWMEKGEVECRDGMAVDKHKS